MQTSFYTWWSLVPQSVRPKVANQKSASNLRKPALPSGFLPFLLCPSWPRRASLALWHWQRLEWKHFVSPSPPDLAGLILLTFTHCPCCDPLAKIHRPETEPIMLVLSSSSFPIAAGRASIVPAHPFLTLHLSQHELILRWRTQCVFHIHRVSSSVFLSLLLSPRWPQTWGKNAQTLTQGRPLRRHWLLGSSLWLWRPSE